MTLRHSDDETDDDAPADRRVAGDLRAIWRHYRGFHRAVLLAGSMAGAAAVAELVMLATVALITSTLGESSRHNPQVLGHEIDVSLGWLIGLAALFVLIRGAFSLSETYLEARLGSRYERDKRAHLASAFLKATWPTQASLRANETQDVATNAITYGRIGAKALGSSMGSICSTTIMLVSALAISWPATLAGIALSFLLAASVQPLVRRSKQVGERVRDLTFRYVATLGETVTLAREVRLADVADGFTTRLDEVSDDIMEQRTEEQVLLNTAPTLFESGALLFVVLGLALLNLTGVGGPARFIAMLLLLLRASQFGRQLQGTYHQLKSALPYLQIVDDTIDHLQGNELARGDRVVKSFEVIELRDVSYEYVTGRAAVERVSLRIHHGEVIGMIGPSGSGKSTIVEILLGLRSPTSGDYLIDGVAQQEFSPGSWHRLTGLVAQEPQLIEGDIAENVRFLRTSVSPDDIEFALDASGLSGDLASMSDGVHTPIGPRSSGISGGQRQRLSIARVLAGRPRLLVLDEPTSALDVHSEEIITTTLERLKGTTTIVVVAHRLSTLRACDKIAVMRAGRLEAFSDRRSLERDSEYFQSALAFAEIRK